jgi:hypothetical protein
MIISNAGLSHLPVVHYSPVFSRGPASSQPCHGSNDEGEDQVAPQSSAAGSLEGTEELSPFPGHGVPGCVNSLLLAHMRRECALSIGSLPLREPLPYSQHPLPVTYA